MNHENEIQYSNGFYVVHAGGNIEDCDDFETEVWLTFEAKV